MTEKLLTLLVSVLDSELIQNLIARLLKSPKSRLDSKYSIT